MAPKDSPIIFDKFDIICVRVSVQDRFIGVLEVFIKVSLWLVELALVP